MQQQNPPTVRYDRRSGELMVVVREKDSPTAGNRNRRELPKTSNLLWPLLSPLLTDGRERRTHTCRCWRYLIAKYPNSAPHSKPAPRNQGDFQHRAVPGYDLARVCTVSAPRIPVQILYSPLSSVRFLPAKPPWPRRTERSRPCEG